MFSIRTLEHLHLAQIYCTSVLSLHHRNMFRFILIFFCTLQLSIHVSALEDSTKISIETKHKKTIDEIFNQNSKKSIVDRENDDPYLKEVRVRLSLPKAIWIKDLISGCKVLNPFPADGEIIKYTGSCKSGFADGEGKVEWFKDGEPNGVSVATWSKGLETGHAIHTWAEGSFDGNFVNGIRQGPAKVLLNDGSQFIGEYKDGKRYGHGVIFRKDGTRLEGEYFQDKFMGYVPPISDEKNLHHGDSTFNFIKTNLNYLIRKFIVGYERMGLFKSALFFCVGLGVGSFLTNLTARFTLLENIKNKGETPHFGYFKPLGYCPTCGTRLTWRNMIPIVSYLIQKGKCHNCKADIGIHYPFVELVTASILLLVSIFWIEPLHVLTFSLCFSTLICIGVMGYRESLIPTYFNFGLIVFGLIAAALKVGSISTEDAILGGAFGFVIPYIYNFTYSRQHWKRNLIEPSNFLLLAAVGVWVGPVCITWIAVVGMFFQGLASTLYASNEFKILDYHKTLICALGVITILVRP